MRLWSFPDFMSISSIFLLEKQLFHAYLETRVVAVCGTLLINSIVKIRDNAVNKFNCNVETCKTD